MTIVLLDRDELDALTADERTAYIASLLRDGYVITKTGARPDRWDGYYNVEHAASGRLIAGNGYGGRFISKSEAQAWVTGIIDTV